MTKGGWLGHWLRRAVHVAMIFIPWIYYSLRIPSWALWVLLFVVIFLEILRLRFGFRIFGQREREMHSVSSCAWGAVSLFLVLLFARPAFAYPIVAACALGDPAMGELRRFSVPSWWVALLGVLLIAGLWLLAGWFFQMSLWWALLMGPLTVAAEWPNFKWIDDNGLMLLVPLSVVLVFC